jgi:hypothetical protein
MDMRCFALKVCLCTVPELIEYLHKNDIEWDRLQVIPGVNLNYNVDLWVVQQVNTSDNIVQIYNKFYNSTHELVSTGMYNLVRMHKNLTYIHQYIYIDMHMSYT